MNVLVMFELFLVVFIIYGVLQFDGIMKVLVPIICMITVVLLERMRLKMKAAKEPVEEVKIAESIGDIEKPAEDAGA